MHNPYRSPVHIPPVPPTPGPKTLNEIQSTARERFAGVIFITKEASRPTEDYFVDYDYYETYSETKSYSKRTYQAAYKSIMREYHNYLCILNTDVGDEYYVVAKRVRSELEALEPYCPCTTCAASVINPLKYVWCPHCTRCIKAGPGFANPEYITKAKEVKSEVEKQRTVPSKYGKYIQGTRWIKAMELAAVAVLFVGVLWIR